MESDLEPLKDAVWEKLNKLTLQELDDVCKGLGLTVEEGKKGKRSALRAVVYRQLTSQEVEEMETDKAIELFTNCQGAIDNLLQIRGMKDEDVDRDTDAHQKAAVTVQAVTPHSSSSQSTGLKTDTKGASASGGLSGLMRGFAKMNAATTPSGSAWNGAGLPHSVRLKREFRIDGTVGSGSKDSLSFPSLC